MGINAINRYDVRWQLSFQLGQGGRETPSTKTDDFSQLRTGGNYSNFMSENPSIADIENTIQQMIDNDEYLQYAARDELIEKAKSEMRKRNAIEVRVKKITRYIPRLKMLSIVMVADVFGNVLTYRTKRKLTKRQERKWV